MRPSAMAGGERPPAESGRAFRASRVSGLAAAVLVAALAACGPGGSGGSGGSGGTTPTSVATDPGSRAADQSLGGQFTGLRDGATVTRQETVSGLVTGVPSGDAAWIVIYPEAAPAYWPQEGPLKLSTAGDFRATAVIGSAAAQNAGQRFVVRLVITSARATARFRAFLAHPSQGLARLPAGARTLARVTVIRG